MGKGQTLGGFNRSRNEENGGPDGTRGPRGSTPRQVGEKERGGGATDR
jgi:hypothetical protein